jgi:hypothetical protein
MHNVIPLSLAVLISVGIIVIGYFYVVSPQRISAGFGLKAPASESDTSAWLRLKGIRDIATVGIVILVFSIIPFGDMSNILVSGGRKATAFSVHGVTCAVMLFAGLLLIHVF